MRLEAQLDQLAALGLGLEPGVTVDDLLHSFDRSEYEKRPFQLVLFVMGTEIESEPWGRRFCRRVWNFDTECVEEPGAYVDIVHHLAAVAGAENRVSGVRGDVDHNACQAWLEYTIDGRHRRLVPKVDTDWADANAVTQIMADIERDGYRFYAKDNGQVAVLFYLDEATSSRLKQLAGNTLTPATGRPGSRIGRALRGWFGL